MLGRENRLTKQEDFDRVKDKGSVTQGTSCAIVVAKAKDPKALTRFGFIVSTKIDKKASLRNRARRALDEGIRRQLYRVKNGYDCVVLAKPIIVKTYTSAVMAEMETLLAKANILKE